jgi:photosystem II stability/assembly factor-like uncharacterized protein
MPVAGARIRVKLLGPGLALGVALSSLPLALGSVPAAAGGSGGGPSPQLTGVSFVSSSTGWAVGQGNFGGAILATNDGGAHWSPQGGFGGGGGLQVGRLSGVSFVSSTTGWAVGSSFSGGGIVTTDNGGATWTSQSVPGGIFNLNSVSFVNSTTGWAVGQGPSGGKILATVDGGATWTPQTVPLGIGSLNGVSFVNSSTGVAVGQGGGGKILVTTNGGGLWVSQTVPGGVGQLNGVNMLSSATGWAVGQGGSGGKILVTTDGGTTWTAQTVPGGVGSLNGVSFANGSIGWAVGGNLAGTSGVILSTTNGGTTWTSQAKPSTNQGLNAVSATGEGNAWAVGTGSCLSQSILATSNSGTTWAEQLSQLPTQPGSLNAVSFVSTSTGWAVGKDSCGLGAVVKTTNGGTTWTYQGVPAGTGGLLGVSFVDASNGWVVGNKAGGFGAVILATSNGGTSWTSQTVPAGVGGLNAVNFVDATHGFAVGQGFSGAVILSSDGTTWTAQTVPTSPSSVGNLFGVNFVDATHGWAVGTDGSFSTAIILGTADGSTWAEQTPPGGIAVLNSASAISTTTAWAVGGGGFNGPPEITTTANSGGTWTAQTPPGGISSGFAGTAFASSSVGWAVDGGGGGGFGAGIAATTNGGGAWSSQTVPGGVNFLNGVSAKDATHAWAVGGGPNGAVILDTTDGSTWGSQTVQLVGPASASVSTVSASPGAVPADGTQQSTITVTLRDANGNLAPGRTVTLIQDGSAVISGSPATTSGDGQASFTATDLTAQSVLFSATDTTDSIPITQQASVTFAPLVAVSTSQYTLANGDGATWQDMDVSNLSLSVSPSANTVAIISANADLFTGSTGVNQDIGIYVTPSNATTYPGNIVAWKESGGFAGTFSPNAAFVETVFPMSMGTTYTVRLRWKTNKSAPGATIYAGAGSGPYSPTRLAVKLVPGSSNNLVQTARSTSQYTLTNSDGTTWQDLDAANLGLTVTPPGSSANWTALISGNADLFTGSTGVNQDIGIYVTPSNSVTYPSNIVAWKESGGFAGTFSPNAAYAQTAFPMTGGSSYSVKLRWKANQSSSGTIYAGAGSGPYSPTRLTVLLVPVGGSSTISFSRTTSQNTLANSDGTTWQTMSPSPVALSTYTPGANGKVIVSANADLFTGNPGYNQDIAIFVSVDGGADTLVAWKESGGFAGTFSPNAAFVQASYNVVSGHNYVFKIKWKTNKNAVGATIYAGAGPWPSPGTAYSPTFLSLASFS